VNAVGVIFAAVNSVASNFKVIANLSVRADTISEDELKNHQGHEGSRRFLPGGLSFQEILRVPSCPWWSRFSHSTRPRPIDLTTLN
jgi:hypothetical protein